MKRCLPPFTGLRAFEAAARLRSFKAAAEELHVTQPAISHQIKKLETFVGVELFNRHPQGVTLSDDGRNYYEDVSAILDTLDKSTARARGDENGQPFVVLSTPAFLSRWLLPRIDAFQEAFPDIDLQIAETDDPMAFPTYGADVLIQYGHVPCPELMVEPFLSSSRYPVASPLSVQKYGAIDAVSGSMKIPLLRDLVGDGWHSWLRRAGIDEKKVSWGATFAHCELTLRAAERGSGAALAYTALMHEEFEENRLVVLSPIETKPKVIYSLVYPDTWAGDSKIQRFRDWLFSAAEETESNIGKLNLARTG